MTRRKALRIPPPLYRLSMETETAFLKSMELYPATLDGSRLVLSTESDFLRYLGERR